MAKQTEGAQMIGLIMLVTIAQQQQLVAAEARRCGIRSYQMKWSKVDEKHATLKYSGVSPESMNCMNAWIAQMQSPPLALQQTNGADIPR